MPEQAPRDCLTGFFLRQALEPFLEGVITEAQLREKHFSLGLIDLDHFKKFNDKFGHPFGDEILKYAASTLKLTFFEQGYQIFRYGGDEFIVVFVDKTPKEAVRSVRQCMYNLLHRPFLMANKCYKVGLSCGIVSFPGDAKTKEELIKRADEAMYFAKRHGRNRIVLYNRIKLLKLQLFFVFLFFLFLLGFIGLFVYQRSFKVIQNKMRSLRIIPKPKDLDTVILKNGGVFEGRILSEIGDKVVVTVYFDKEEGSMLFDRSEIAQIKYGQKEPGENK